METIPVRTSDPYEIILGGGLLGALGVYTCRLAKNCRVMIVSDDHVFPLYGNAAEESLKNEGFSVFSFVFSHGEASKTLETYASLIESMMKARMDRSDLVIALGGGVVGDVAGFAAATYERGIRYVQVPTTLLAAVDSSVGGKTGIDFGGEKNRIGAFYQPALVLTDPETFRTLSEEVYLSGVAETLKYGVIGSESLFEECVRIPVKDRFEQVVKACVEMKRDFVEADEYDHGSRMLLNFGHTFGHAVEAAGEYALPHGFAVSIGMAMVTKAAVKKGYCGEETIEKLLNALKQYGLPTEPPYSADALLPYVLGDKKRSGDAVRIVIPRSIGRAETVPVPVSEIRSWLVSGGAECDR
ncbi:MAG: 3-dehydroquinate synthase [Lachnospiraceae bacterium]|nr:3-dehydroquinate synthase [Lachnospiraceae bacterium]